MATKDLSELRSTVIRIRGRVARYRSDGKSIGEENTKVNLIEPVLAALGWDVHELDEVRREYRLSAKYKPVDYGLFAYRTPLLFVEAKSLDQVLGDHKWASQVLSYASVAGVEWCVLTNGDEYRIFNVLAPVSLDEKLFRTVRASDSGEEDHVVETLSLLSKENLAGNRLSLLWKAHHVDRQVGRAIDRVISHPTPAFIRVIRSETKGLTPRDIKASLQRVKVSIDVASTRITPPPLVRTSGKKGGQGNLEQRTSKGEVTLSSLISAGLIRPPLRLERKYKKNQLAAEIRSDGRIFFGGQLYDSPSTAGGMARKSVIGTRPGRAYPQTNGWMFWKYRDDDTGKLRALDVLRQRYLKRTGDQTIDSDASAFASKGLRLVKHGKKSELSKA